ATGGPRPPASPRFRRSRTCPGWRRRPEHLPGARSKLHHVSSVPPSRPGAPTPPERPELPDGIAPPATPSPRTDRPRIEFRPPARRPFAPEDGAPPWPPWTAFVALVGAFA